MGSVEPVIGCIMRIKVIKIVMPSHGLSEYRFMLNTMFRFVFQLTPMVGFH